MWGELLINPVCATVHLYKARQRDEGPVNASGRAIEHAFEESPEVSQPVCLRKKLLVNSLVIGPAGVLKDIEKDG